MLKNCLSVALAVAGMSVTMGVQAAAPEGESIPPKQWSGETSVTYLLKNGNTESSTLGGRLLATQDLPSWRFTYRLEGTNEEKSDERIAEKYFGSAKADWKVFDPTYVFGLVEHEDNRFGNFDHQTSLNLGLGYTAIDSDAHKLSLEAGPGYRRTKTLASEVEEESTARLALNYAWQISPSAALTEQLSSQYGDDATVTRSQTQLKAKINSKLSLTLGYDVVHTSHVPDEIKKTDNETYVSLDYSF
jgi:putative salt-induced outer membrane protein YdiY